MPYSEHDDDEAQDYVAELDDIHKDNHMSMKLSRVSNNLNKTSNETHTSRVSKQSKES